jgi:hypothetical protein
MGKFVKNVPYLSMPEVNSFRKSDSRLLVRLSVLVVTRLLTSYSVVILGGRVVRSSAPMYEVMRRVDCY